MDGTRISVSQATTELSPKGGGSRLIYMENGNCLDGPDGVTGRREGTEWILDISGRSSRARGSGCAKEDQP